MRSSRARTVALAVALLAGGAAAGRTAAGPPAACPGDEIRALDVGQGTAVLLRAGGAAVLADGGPRAAGLVRALRGHGVRRLDAVIASHPHADHTEGLVEVLQAMPVGVVLAPPTIGWGVGRDVLEAAERAGVPVTIGHAGDAWQVGAIRLEALSPDPEPVPEENLALINAYNLVIRARVGRTRVLLPGDADGDLQRRLPGSGVVARVLVGVHHGSADVDEDFVDAVSPQVTLVTVGADNRYGHPAERALRIYGGHGPVLRTDRHGEVAVCDGEVPEVRRQR